MDSQEHDKEVGERRRRVGSLSWVIPVVVLTIFTGMIVYRLQSQEVTAEPVREQARQSVHVVVARSEPIQSWVFADGTARSVQREYLTFEISGRVTMVAPEKEGVRVKKGDVLAELDHRKYAADVDAAKASIQEAKTQLEASQANTTQSQTQLALAQSQFARSKRLFERDTISQSELEEAQAAVDNAEAALAAVKAQTLAVRTQIDVAEARLRQAQIALEETQLISPIDGIVAYLNVEEGFYFTPNLVRTTSEAEALQTIPMVVIDPSQYEITVDVPSFEASRIDVGQEVIILPGGSSAAATLNAVESPSAEVGEEKPLWQARGVVYSVNPAVNPGGRSVRIKVRTTQGAEYLRDGMFVTCWIATENRSEAVVVPFNALLYEENRPFVFVVEPQTNVAQRRAVRLGIQGLKIREIAEGVEPGDMLVTDGRYRLVDGAPVRIVNAGEETAGENSPSNRVDSGSQQ